MEEEDADSIERVMWHQPRGMAEESLSNYKSMWYHMAEGHLYDSEPDWNEMEFYIKWKGQSHLHCQWKSFFELQNLSGFKNVINYTKKVMEDVKYRKAVSREEQQDDDDDDDFDQLFRMKLKKEQDDYKKRCQAQGCLYRILKVVRDDDLFQQIGKDIYFDLVDHKKVHHFRIQKQTPFIEFKEKVAKEFGIPVKLQHYWFWSKRQNHTYRPHQRLTSQDEAQMVGKLRQFNKAENAELTLFLEVVPELEQYSIPPPGTGKWDILLFFKLYDPKKEELRYVGNLTVNCTGKPIEIVKNINELAGFDPDEEIELYEEVKFEPRVSCEYLDKGVSFQSSEIVDGGIICFQRHLQPHSMEEYRYPNVPSFLEYLKNRQLKKEHEERKYKRRCEEEPQAYTILKVARDDDLFQQIGKDIYFDLVDYEKVPHFRIQKQMPFIKFKEEVTKEFGIPVRLQRYWFWTKRQNHTYRPHRCLTSQEEAQMVGKLTQVSNKANNAELTLFLEVVPELREQCSIPPPGRRKGDILLFFKLYDPKKEELRYVGNLTVNCTRKPIEIVRNINELAGFDPDEEIELYEEVKFKPCVMCEHLDKGVSFRLSQIEDGDIICFQRHLQPRSVEKYRYPDVPSFLEDLKNRQAKPEGAECAKKPFRHYHEITASEMRRQKDVKTDDSFASNDNTPTRSQSNSQNSSKRPKKLKNDDQQFSKLNEWNGILAGAFKDMVNSEKLPMTGEELWAFVNEMGLDDVLASDAFVFLLQRSLHLKGLMATPTGIRKSVLVKMMKDVKK